MRTCATATASQHSFQFNFSRGIAYHGANGLRISPRIPPFEPPQLIDRRFPFIRISSPQNINRKAAVAVLRMTCEDIRLFSSCQVNCPYYV
jgi:hypothetical protein